jgi:DNA polymerase-4
MLRRIMARTIIHVDLDAFYCSIEEKRDPSLVGRPFAVGGRSDQRGVVASCSYAARQFGVRSAMSMARAFQICPQLLRVPPRFSDYRAASSEVMARLHQLTPLVEQISIDEAFLDVSEIIARAPENRDGRKIGLWLQRRIQRELALSCSLGVASNKLVAKIATDYGKAAVGGSGTPHAICVVPPGEESAFLAPLPVTALWGVGPKTGENLARIGIRTIGELAEKPLNEMVRRFGAHGYDLSQHARGIDKREIVTVRETKSVSNETTFSRDIDDWDVLQQTLEEQAQSVAAQLQKHNLRGTTIQLKLRWSDFTTPTRQTTLASPTAQASEIAAAGIKLLRQLWTRPEPVRLLGIGVSGLSTHQQLNLWDDAPTTQSPAAQPVLADTNTVTQNSVVLCEKQQRISAAIALLQERYGERVVQPAARVAGKPE